MTYTQKQREMSCLCHLNVVFYPLQSTAGGQRQQLSEGDARCHRPHKGRLSYTHVVRCTKKQTNVNQMHAYWVLI